MAPSGYPRSVAVVNYTQLLAITTLDSTDRALVFCTNHPIWGATLLYWDGTTWQNGDYASSQNFYMLAPGGGTALTVLGSAQTTSGTIAHPTPATTNKLTSERRATLSTNTTAGNIAFVRQNTLMFVRGNANNIGGFSYSARFGWETLVAGIRSFVGLADSIATPTNVDPLTTTTPGGLGVAINANTGNLRLVNNITGTARNSVDLGSNFPVNTTNFYELDMYCVPNDSLVYYQVTNLNSGNFVSGTWSSALTGSIPNNTTYLAPLSWVCNNATAAACTMSLGVCQAYSRS